MNASASLPITSKLHIALLSASILAIALHFALIGSNPVTIGSIPIIDIPLLAVIIVGGIPLQFEIFRKLFQGIVGADFLGAIELVAASLLDQYLAAVLIIIMLSGGQALEAHAIR